MPNADFLNLFEGKVGEILPGRAYLFLGIENSGISEVLASVAKKINARREDLFQIENENIDGKPARNATHSVAGRPANISIKQIRELLHKVSLTPAGDAKIISVIGAEFLNREASNALLKVLEEPPKDTLMFLFAGRDTMILTIKSRVTTYDFRARDDINRDFLEIESMLKESFAKQSKQIESMVKENQVNNFLQNLSNYYRERMLKLTDDSVVTKIKNVEEAKMRIGKKANQRLQLENLMLKLTER